MDEASAGELLCRAGNGPNGARYLTQQEQSQVGTLYHGKQKEGFT